MPIIPPAIAEFLDGSHIAVAGVSRDPRQPANAIFRRLRETGHDVVPVNPGTAEAEGVTCYPDVGAVPGRLDGVVFAAHPRVALGVVRQCADRGIRRVWFHRSVGQGSLSVEAVHACRDLGITCIPGGCPMMFCGDVDPFHRCMRWFFQRTGRVPS